MNNKRQLGTGKDECNNWQVALASDLSNRYYWACYTAGKNADSRK
jgi:hypothetical protein